MLIRPNMKWCCVIKVYIRHPTQSFTPKKKDFICTLLHKGLLGVLNESWLSDWASDWGRASRGKRIRTVWLLILLVKNGHGAMVAHAHLQAHGTHIDIICS